MIKKLMKSLVVSCLLCCAKAHTKVKNPTKESVVNQIVETANLYNVNPNLALAIVDVESGFNPEAKRYEPRYRKNTIGLFQLFHATAKEVGYHGDPKSLYSINNNILFGVKYIAKCQKIVGTRVHRIACCYNAGWAAKESYCRKNASVIRHTKRIITTMRKYENLNLFPLPLTELL